MTLLLVIPSLLLGLTVHEFAHAWSASLLGDDFARRLGRVSLNPLRHLSLMGTVAMFVIQFGWGKPVPVNLYNFRHPKRDYLITSLAGPFANAVMVALSIALMAPLSHTLRFGPVGEPAAELALLFLRTFAFINVLLAVLNLLPIPPLDGSKIWPCLVPGLRPTFNKGLMLMSIIVLVVVVKAGGLERIYAPMIAFTHRLMPTSDRDRLAVLWNDALRTCESKNGAASEEACTKILAIQPQSHEALNFRASMRISQGKLQEALQDAQAAVDLKPDNKNYREMLDLAQKRLQAGTQPGVH